MNGERIRSARKRLGLTLAEVSQRTGYTIGFLSLVERNLKQPSLAALRKIADCLECSEVWLLMGENEDYQPPDTPAAETPVLPHMPDYLIPVAGRRRLILPEITTRYEIFTPSALPQGAQAKMTGLITRLEPGYWVSEQMISHHKLDESIFLLEGRLQAMVGTRSFFMQSGDSLYIPEGTLHNYQNIGDTTASVLVYFSGLIY